MAKRATGNVVVEDARIIFRNFKGEGGMYNREGDRNFAVVLPPNVADDLEKQGYNVKRREPREEGDEGLIYLSIKVKFDGPRPPRIHMITTRGTTVLDEETCGMLDDVEIGNVDLIFGPYNWAVGDKTGVSAYLQDIYVTIIENPLQLKYNNMEIATVEGPAMDSSEGPLKVRSERATSRRELEEA